MAYRSLSCPQCNTKLERNKVIYGGYGCPIKICTECGETLIDPAIKEAALKTPFAFHATVLLDLLRVVVAVWAMCVVFAYFILELFWDMGQGWPMIICGTAISVVFLIVRYRRLAIKPRDVKQEIEDSIVRLDDPQYANFLASAEIYIYEDSMYCNRRGKDKANFSMYGYKGDKDGEAAAEAAGVTGAAKTAETAAEDREEESAN